MGERQVVVVLVAVASMSPNGEMVRHWAANALLWWCAAIMVEFGVGGGEDFDRAALLEIW